MQETLNTLTNLTSPMEVVGKFMDMLFKDDHSLPQRCLVKPSLSCHIRSTTSHSVQLLYSCPTHSQLDLICLILNIFSGIPEAYQVLHCKASTTEEELSRFLQRVEKHRAHYLVLDVNRLPFKLQEVSEVIGIFHLSYSLCLPQNLVQVHYDTQRTGQDMPSTIHFVETAPSILHEMPWILSKNSKVGVV